MTLGEHIQRMAEAGLAIAEDTNERLEIKLTILLNIEDVLDKGRGYATEEERADINQTMDTLRGKIRELLDAMPREDARAFMANRGRQAQNQFSIE